MCAAQYSIDDDADTTNDAREWRQAVSAAHIVHGIDHDHAQEEEQRQRSDSSDENVDDGASLDEPPPSANKRSRMS